MTNEARADDEVAVAEEQVRTWQPSRRPQHHVEAPAAPAARIVEQSGQSGVRGALRAFLNRRFVKLIIGLGIFILGAIVYDATVNFGSWTERKAKPKATQHKGVERAPKVPD
ncbi:MAG TPA: hypothetical protein VN231_00295 [Allosphingosinicella sp.]|nr:hypothetical protein [Allosphingosinicella sp.]